MGLVLLGGGIGVAVVPFTVDAVVREAPRVEVTTDCPAPVSEAFTHEADSAYFLAGQDEPVVSPAFGCGSPSRKRVAAGGAGILIGGALLVAIGGRRRVGTPVTAVTQVTPEPTTTPTSASLPAPPPAPPAPPLPAAPVTEAVVAPFYPTPLKSTPADPEEWSEPDWIAPDPEPALGPASVSEAEPPNVDDMPPLVGSLEELEQIRARQVLRAHLPTAPARVVEVGPSVHAGWMTESGYRVDGVVVGESGFLDLPNGGHDVVLLIGPLTAVGDRDGRVSLLSEARRVVRPGGLVAVGATNRFAALFAGLAQGQLFDDDQRDAIGATLGDGVRGRSHLHHPDELRSELADAGLTVEDLVGLEGLAGWLPHLREQWASLDGRRVIVQALQGIESEESLLGLSAHLLAIARR